MAEAMESLKTGVAMLVLLGVLIGALALALDGFREGIIDDIDTSTATNESITLSNGTAVSLTNNYVVGVTTILVNLSGSYQDLGSDNYTLGSTESSSVGTITLTDATYDGNTSLVTYTYRDEYSTYQANATLEGLEGTSNATSYLSTIGTLLGVGALLAVVVFGFRYATR